MKLIEKFSLLPVLLIIAALFVLSPASATTVTCATGSYYAGPNACCPNGSTYNGAGGCTFICQQGTPDYCLCEKNACATKYSRGIFSCVEADLGHGYITSCSPLIQ